MLNPGGSVKDRIGLPMIEAAERAGLLRPGGTIIEPTSGNTGHGLAIAAALKGYRCIFVMADKQSAEKQALLRAYGAEVVLCPTNVAPESPESYYSVAARLARDIPGAFKPDQYWNQENPRAHETHDRPGDLAPDRRPRHPLRGQRRHRRHDQRGGPLPQGPGSGRARHRRRPGRAASCRATRARPYLTEGVGEDFMPGTFDPAVIDRWVRVSDRDAFAMARRLTREEGILAGESCGTALVAALDEAARLMREEPASASHAVMVVLLAGRRPQLPLQALQRRVDAGQRPGGLPDGTGARRPAPRGAAWRRRAAGGRAGPHDRAGRRPSSTRCSGSASARCRSRSGADDAIEGIVGSISERSLLERAYRDPSIVERTVGEVMERPLPMIATAAALDEAFQLLSDGAPALVAVADGRPAGIVTKLDLLEFLAHRST